MRLVPSPPFRTRQGSSSAAGVASSLIVKVRFVVPSTPPVLPLISSRASWTLEAARPEIGVIATLSAPELPSMVEERSH